MSSSDLNKLRLTQRKDTGSLVPDDEKALICKNKASPGVKSLLRFIPFIFFIVSLLFAIVIISLEKNPNL